MDGDWEAIPTTNESYGYNENDHSHKPAVHFIRLLASAAARGGNILMNVGPKGDGSMDLADIAILKGIAAWMKGNEISVHNVDKSGLPTQSWGETTMKGDSLFLHVYHYPQDGRLYLSGMNAGIEDVSFLISGQKVKKQRLNRTDWLLHLPAGEIACMDTVILVRKKGEIRPSKTRLLLETIPNILLAFDADLSGDNFGHGDGKKLRNYINNWKNTEGKLEWEVKTIKSASFDIELEFTGASGNEKGKMQLCIDDRIYPFEYSARINRADSKKLATVRLKPGKHKVALKGIEFEGKEFLRPLSLTFLATQ